MAQEGHYILNYIDDHVIFGKKQDCQRAFDRLTELLTELGFTISIQKNVLPSTEVICLGILINTKTFEMSFPPGKLREIREMVNNWTHRHQC